MICASCGHRLLLDTDALAHFEFPAAITVHLADSLGQALRIAGIRIQAERGFTIGDVPTDAEGTARITREHYQRSHEEYYSWSIMDHIGDHSLNRYVTLWAEGAQNFGPERTDLENSGENPVVWLKKA